MTPFPWEAESSSKFQPLRVYVREAVISLSLYVQKSSPLTLFVLGQAQLLRVVRTAPSFRVGSPSARRCADFQTLIILIY